MFSKNCIDFNIPFHYQQIRCKKIKIVNNIILRQEKEGYIIGKGLNQLFVTMDSGDLLFILKQKDSFKIDEVSKEFGIPEAVLDNFLFILYKKGIISIIS